MRTSRKCYLVTSLGSFIQTSIEHLLCDLELDNGDIAIYSSQALEGLPSVQETNTDLLTVVSALLKNSKKKKKA